MEKSKANWGINVSCILTFIVIFVSNDTLLFGTNRDRTFFWLHVGILIACFSYILFHTPNVCKNAVFFLLFLMSAMAITQIVNLDEEIIKYVYNAFALLLCMLFCRCVNKRDFCRAYTSIIYYITVFACLLFMLWIFAEPIARMFPSIANENDIRYYFFGLGFLEDLKTGVLPRMYGIFREPGVFACFLIMALIIQLFFEEKLNVKRIVIISVAAILTFSTAAYVLVFFVLGGYFVKQIFAGDKGDRKVWLLLLILTLVFATLFAAIGSEKIFGVVFNKLEVENSSRDSRFGSIGANLEMFLENPIFGKGWNYVEENFTYFSSQGEYKGAHNTNTFLKFLALYGIGPFLCVVCATFLFFKKMCKSALWGIFTMAIWIVALSNEDLSVNVLFYILPFYAFEKEEKRREPTLENIIN